LIAGGQYGEGALRIQGKTVEYYSIAAGSFGLQAGSTVEGAKFTKLKR
jgi:lipid-binding SYLF domain-containing protein